MILVMVAKAFPYRRANRLLLVLIVLINGYVVAAPFWPQLEFWSEARTDKAMRLQQTIDQTAPPSKTTPEPDTLTIPSMMFSGTINQGTDTYTELEKGVWLWPHGSRPHMGSNTIMLAHRFTYTDPRGAFYFLDKVQPGDRIGLTWQNKRYVYKTISSKVVSPEDVGILNPTAEPTLTLYTCTPLWNPTKRLVITARLEPEL
jgi:LPXTG-site transpeptidase (sortase) family protein